MRLPRVVTALTALLAFLAAAARFALTTNCRRMGPTGARHRRGIGVAAAAVVAVAAEWILLSPLAAAALPLLFAAASVARSGKKCATLAE